MRLPLSSKKHRIVILGAGFAGLRTALDLPRKLRGISHEITLVDRSDTHLYTPDLYEIASAFEQDVSHACMVRLKETVATPIVSLLKGVGVKFVQDWVQSIDPKKKRVHLRRAKAVPYDTLVVALGSEVAYFNIPGLEKYAYPLKTVRDALAIHSNLDQLFQNSRRGRTARALPRLDVVVGGGGAAGVELVGEVAHYVTKLCKKYRYPAAKVRVHLVEGQEELAGLGPRGTTFVVKRLERTGIRVHLRRFITHVTARELRLKTKSGKKEALACRFLVWTGGVKVNQVVADSVGRAEARGAIPVDEFLRSVDHPGVFAAGDNAAFPDLRTGKPFPMLAQFAWMEGQLIAENIARLLRKIPLKPAKLHRPIMVVPVGGMYGVMRVGRLLLKGKRVWLLHRLISLRYALTLLPFWKAFFKWKKDSRIFAEND